MTDRIPPLILTDSPSSPEEALGDQLDRLNINVQRVLHDPQLLGLVSPPALRRSCEESLDRALMQLEDFLSRELRKNPELDWADEEFSMRVDTDVIPFSSPQKTCHSFLQDDFPEPPYVWTCCYSDLVALYSQIQHILEQAQRGVAIQSELKLGLKAVEVNLEAYCPMTPKFAAKGFMAAQITKYIGKADGATFSLRQQAYISQLENELASQLSCDPTPLSQTPADPSFELTLDEAIARLVLPAQPSQSRLPHSLSLALQELRRLKAQAQSQFQDLQGAVVGLKQCEEEYKAAITDAMSQVEEMNRRLRAANEERDWYREELEMCKGRLQHVAAKVSEATDKLEPPSPSPAVEKPSVPASIDSDIAALEAELSQCEPWKQQKLKVRLALLKNKQLRAQTELAISGSQEKSMKLMNKTAALESSFEGRLPRRRPLGNASFVCNSRNASVLEDFSTPGERMRNDPGDFEDRENAKVCIAKHSAVRECTLSTMAQESAMPLKEGKLKSEHVPQMDRYVQSVQARLSTLNQGVRAEKDLNSHDTHLFHSDLALIRDKLQTRLITEMQEKYTFRAAAAPRKAKKLSEDLVTLDEAMDRREQHHTDGGKEALTVLSARHSQCPSLSHVQGALVSLASESRSLL